MGIDDELRTREDGGRYKVGDKGKEEEVKGEERREEEGGKDDDKKGVEEGRKEE